MGFNIIPQSELDRKKCHSRQQDLNPGPCGCKSNAIPTQLQQHNTLWYKQKWFIYERLILISFLVMKVVSCGLDQRIIVIHGGSLVSILNIPSLSLSVRRISRVNLSWAALPRDSPSRFSLEILPPSFDRGYSRILTLLLPGITIL